jgi:hypothetical protein
MSNMIDSIDTRLLDFKICIFYIHARVTFEVVADALLLCRSDLPHH